MGEERAREAMRKLACSVKKVNDVRRRRDDEGWSCCLRSMCGVTMWDRLRNEEVRERVGVPEKMSNRVDRKVLKWFGHVERMGGERLTKRVYMSEVEGVRGRGRPYFRFIDGVRE